MINLLKKLKYLFSLSLAIAFVLLFKEQIDVYKLNINSKFESKKLVKQINEKFELFQNIIKIYSNLYDYIRNGYTQPKFSNFSYNYSLTRKKGNICICSIGKKENLYAREFVDYFLNLGVDKLFIYDNNDVNGEKFESVLSTYIKNKYVDIIDVRGLSSIQIPIYNYCYQKNKYFYDWIGFLDFDEYLYIENNKSIKNYLHSEIFNKCQVILFNWIIYNDNDLLEYSKIKLNIRFTRPTLNSTNVKSFVRGNIPNLLIPTSHFPGINVFKFCNSKGEFIYPKNFISYNFDKNPKAYIKHFFTKTVKEFCDKLYKGNAHFYKNHYNYQKILKKKLELFIQLNKMTKEKKNLLEKCLNIKLNDYNLSLFFD